MVSEMVKKLTPSATLALTAKVAALRAEGVDVLAFNLGEPDFNTPENIMVAAKAAMDQGYTKYTAVPGIMPLRKAIVAKLKADNGLDYQPAQICVSTGAKQALFNALLAVLNPGDEVLIPTPCWVSYCDMVTIAGGVPVTFPTKEEDGFQIKADVMEAAVTSRTKMIILNSPNNPTGAIYPRTTLEAVAEICEKHNIIVLADEIYEKLIYADEPYVSIASLSEGMKARTVTVNGFSKAYAMTGWRIGYSAAPEDIAKGISAIQGHTTSNANTISQYAALEALTGPQDSVAAMKEAFRARRDYLAVRLLAVPGIACAKADGAFYLMPNVSAYFGKTAPDGTVISDSSALCGYLLDSAHISVVSGNDFCSPGNLRISYANSMEELAQGMDRFEQALSKLK